MKTLALFNNKGGVGKTTLSINLAEAFSQAGLRVLMVDTDPQCNLSSFYLPEVQLDSLLDEQIENGERANTIWAAIEPVVIGRGSVREITPRVITDRISLLVGDVLLSRYEEELPSAWTESFARKSRGYDVMCALSQVVRNAGRAHDADLIIYDVGPNLGALNRTILLDSDFFATPVHTDLYSLRALTTVGSSIARWIRDWSTVRDLASTFDANFLLHGRPSYIGYISSAYRMYGGEKARPHEYWERQLPSRVKAKVVDELRAVDESLAGTAPYKLGEVKQFNTLAALSQTVGKPIANLRPFANSGQFVDIDAIARQFKRMAQTMMKRMSIAP